jgi:hypothetical protein
MSGEIKSYSVGELYGCLLMRVRRLRLTADSEPPKHKAL